jgi:putative endonuclease
MKVNESCYWVYILLCSNNTYYTGYTNNLERRYQSHLDGTGKCKYTRSFKPIQMIQFWKINGDKAQAMEIERAIKRLSRGEKEKLIANPSSLSRHFPSLSQDIKQEKLIRDQ